MREDQDSPLEPSDVLAQKNPHDRDQRIRFIEDSHRYLVDGVEFTSATNWVGQFFPRFDQDAVIEKMMDSKNWPNSKYFGMSSEAIKAVWAEKGRQAAEKGNHLHESIEYRLNGLNHPNPSSEVDRFDRFFRDHGHQLGEPFRTEWRVFDEQARIAGTLDGLFLRPGQRDVFTLCDWKRAREINTTNRWQSGNAPLGHLPDTNFHRYSLQQNVYARILKEQYGISVAKMMLVQIHPELERAYLVHNVPPMDREIDAMLEHRRRHTMEMDLIHRPEDLSRAFAEIDKAAPEWGVKVRGEAMFLGGVSREIPVARVVDPGLLEARKGVEIVDRNMKLSPEETLAMIVEGVRSSPLLKEKLREWAEERLSGFQAAYFGTSDINKAVELQAKINRVEFGQEYLMTGLRPRGWGQECMKAESRLRNPEPLERPRTLMELQDTSPWMHEADKGGPRR